MHRPALLTLALLGFLILAVAPLQNNESANAQDAETTTFFDDFTYPATDDETFIENGWIVRTEEGWPGVPGATWKPEGVSIIDDPDQAEGENNRVVEMRITTDGTPENTTQAQFCQQRKFLEGTYAARVYFTDAPVNDGPDGDQIVQTFYLISPLEFEMDPAYSEIDFEYLPNGGWGVPDSILFGTTWETFRPEPNWEAVNTSGTVPDSQEGWHTLVVSVWDGRVTYWIDGVKFGTHRGDYYPETPMSINFNLWFIRGGQAEDDAREWVEYIDWVYFTHAGLTYEEATAEVDALRESETAFVDEVAALDPPLDSPCNF